MSTNAARRGGQGTIPQDNGGSRWATPGPLDIVGYEKLTVSTVSVGLAAIPLTADSVILRVESNPIRYRGDGTAPTATDGMGILATDAPFTFLNLGYDELAALRFIRSGATDGTLHVTYIRARG